MRLRFTRRAVDDLHTIAAYLRARNPAASRRVRNDLYEGLRNILLFPAAGRPQTIAGVRKLVTRTYAYLIYYTVDDRAGDLIVLNVKHPARQREYDDQ